MHVIDIEAHWISEGIDVELRAQPPSAADASVALNDREEIPERLRDLDELRIAAMDAGGVALQVLSLAPPAASGLAPDRAVTLSAEANDQAAEAVRRHPTRLRAMTTLPLRDPDASVAELERAAGLSGHVGVMTYGRVGDRHLDDPVYDEVLAAAASLNRPIFVHSQIPLAAVREASYSGLDPLVELGLATFGWGWHLEAATAALRLILSGALDRHPGLQIVLGHWGELLLFWLDRVESLSRVSHLQRPIVEYFETNISITSSGMFAPRLLRHALDYTRPERLLFSGDYPFHALTRASTMAFLDQIDSDPHRDAIAHANAAALFDLDPAEPRPGPSLSATLD